MEEYIDNQVKILGIIHEIIDSRNFKSLDVIIKNERDESIYLVFNQDELIEFLKKQLVNESERLIDTLTNNNI